MRLKKDKTSALQQAADKLSPSNRELTYSYLVELFDGPRFVKGELHRIDIHTIATKFVQSLYASNALEEYCIERIVRVSNLRKTSHWFCSEDYGYLPEANEVKRLGNIFKSMIDMSNADKVKAALKEEYGYILPQLQDLKNAETITLPINDIEVANGDYLRKLEKEYVDQYDNTELLRGVVIKSPVSPNACRLIDGYHRYASALNQKLKKVEMIILK